MGDLNICLMAFFEIRVHINHVSKIILFSQDEMGVGGAVRFLVVGTIGQEERPPRGQLWMEQCLTSLKYWPI